MSLYRIELCQGIGRWAFLMSQVKAGHEIESEAKVCTKQRERERERERERGKGEG